MKRGLVILAAVAACGAPSSPPAKRQPSLFAPGLAHLAVDIVELPAQARSRARRQKITLTLTDGSGKAHLLHRRTVTGTCAVTTARGALDQPEADAALVAEITCDPEPRIAITVDGAALRVIAPEGEQTFATPEGFDVVTGAPQMMRDGEPPTGTAVEPPEEHVKIARVPDLSKPRIRHRFLAFPGGALLVVAMFLPAMKECGETRYPLDTPQLLGPYLLGGVLALVSLLPARIRDYGLRIFALVSLLHYAVLVAALVVLTAQDLDAAGTLVLVLVAGGSVFLVARRATTVEERAAGMALLQALQWSLWFAMWNVIEGALIGMRVALVGALLVTLGAVVWLRDSRTRT